MLHSLSLQLSLFSKPSYRYSIISQELIPLFDLCNFKLFYSEVRYKKITTLLFYSVNLNEHNVTKNLKYYLRYSSFKYFKHS